MRGSFALKNGAQDDSPSGSAPNKSTHIANAETPEHGPGLPARAAPSESYLGIEYAQPFRPRGQEKLPIGRDQPHGLFDGLLQT